MAISNLGNIPVTVTIGGRELKVKRLSIQEIFGTAENAVKSALLKDIMEMAKGLQGREKMDFLMESQKALPKGADLNEQAQAWLNSPDGIASMLRLGLNKCQEVGDDEISAILTSSEAEEAQMILQHMIGIEADKADKPEEGEKKSQ